MKTMLLAAAAALSLGIGSAYAGDGQGPSVGYIYPGSVFAGVIQNAPPTATAQNGQETHAYITQSDPRRETQRTWIAPPVQNYLGR